jgi:hypothetical protein
LRGAQEFVGAVDVTAARVRVHAVGRGFVEALEGGFLGVGVARGALEKLLLQRQLLLLGFGALLSLGGQAGEAGRVGCGGFLLHLLERLAR